MEAITFSNEPEMKELYDKYDEIINITLLNIYSLSKNKGEIVLSNIDRKNKDHLFVLRVALLAKDIYNFPLKIKVGFWEGLRLNWRMKKLSRRVPRIKECENAINVADLIDFMYGPIWEYMGEDFEFSNIYDTFYRKELG